MKRILFLCAAIFLLCQTAVLAHTMTRDEMYVGGVGRGCSLGYVASVYGEPADKKEFRGDGIRSVTYIYSPTFSITAVGGARDVQPESDLRVNGFSCKDAYLKTPTMTKVDEDGRKMYIYDVYHGIQEMVFYVDANEVITEIRAGTEI